MDQEVIKEKAKIFLDDVKSLCDTGMKPVEIAKYLKDRRDNLVKEFGDDFTICLLDEMEQREDQLRDMGFIE